MRSWGLALLVSAGLAGFAAPAEAAWKSYVSKELGFSFMAPGDLKIESGTFRGALAGPRQTIVYRFNEDNIDYKVTVMSFVQVYGEGATILGERTYMFQDSKEMFLDTFARVGSGKDAIYGRKMVVEQPEGKGRTTASFFFNKGRMISLEATVLPGKGNLQSPDLTRFIDSIAFAPSSTEQGAEVLPEPVFE